MIAHTDLIAALNRLLEAERAGARVARESMRDAGSSDAAALLKDVRDDEARWCAMLAHHIARLGATPSRVTGAFHGKAMAIAEPAARLAFLNRGQAWVVRKLEQLMAGIDDAELGTDLRAMWDSHRVNIRRTEDHLIVMGHPTNQAK